MTSQFHQYDASTLDGELNKMSPQWPEMRKTGVTVLDYGTMEP